MKRPVFVLATLVCAAVLVAGCGAGSTPTLPSGSPVKSSSSAPTPSATPLAGCDNADRTRVESYAPAVLLPAANKLPADSTMGNIRGRKLIAAVSADNLLFGFRNPINNQLEGFDIDMIRTVARAIFGPATDSDIDRRIDYRVVNFAQRIPALQSEQVDIVADIMTINCARWGQIAFSAEYYHASQQVLVPKGSGLDIDKLADKKVCTANGSTGSENLKNYPKVKPVLVDNISDCMVLFQQGSVDGIISDNTVVAGFASQDPYAEVAERALTDEPYGLGFQSGQKDFVQFVNSVLERMHADGTWTKLYTKWLRPTLGSGESATQPTPVYGR